MLFQALTTACGPPGAFNFNAGQILDTKAPHDEPEYIAPADAKMLEEAGYLQEYKEEAETERKSK